MSSWFHWTEACRAVVLVLAAGVGGTAAIAAQGSIQLPAQSPSRPPVYQAEGLYTILVPVEGEPLPEVGLLGIPPQGQFTGDRPLLVFFHSFGVSPSEVESTQFVEQAAQRGWYLWSAGSRSPVGARDVNYGSVESQVFTAAGIDYVVDNYPIDVDRIYGVGFSMGSAQATAFAARHRDPRRPMFAAVVNHEGTIDQADTWRQNLSARSFLNQIFGGSPVFEPFAYRRASVLELDPITRALVPGGDHQADNLTRTPLQQWYALNTPAQDLVDQTLRMDEFMTAAQNPDYELNVVAGNVHGWSTLPEVQVCDWLATKRLEIANEGRLRMDRNARWLYFDVGGVTPDRFASLSYDMDLGSGSVRLTGSESLTTIRTNLRRWNSGFGQGLPLELTLGAVDAGDTVVLSGVLQAPLGVLRDGLPQASGWSYDPVLQELTVVETAAGQHLWRFEP